MEIKIGNYPIEPQICIQGEVVQVYGLILYTDSHPNIKKALRDDDYWNALDVNSGSKIAIFAVKPDVGEYYRRRIKVDPHSSVLMIPTSEVWKEPERNKELLKELGLGDTKKLPLFIIFTEINGEPFYCAYKIDGNDANTIYHSINKIVTIMKNVVERFKPENLSNMDSLFREIKGDLEYIHQWQNFFTGLDTIKKIKSYLNLI